MTTRKAFEKLISDKDAFMNLKNSSKNPMTDVNYRQIKRRFESKELRESQMEDLLKQAGWKKNIEWSKK